MICQLAPLSIFTLYLLLRLHTVLGFCSVLPIVWFYRACFSSMPSPSVSLSLSLFLLTLACHYGTKVKNVDDGGDVLDTILSMFWRRTEIYHVKSLK